MKEAELKYSTDHLWVAVEGDAARLGITDYAQNQLGDLVFIEFLKTNNRLVQGEVFGRIESMKVAEDLRSPITGEVVSINKVVSDMPEVVNKDPYGEGWLIRIHMTIQGELEGLMSYESYRKSLQG